MIRKSRLGQKNVFFIKKRVYTSNYPFPQEHICSKLA